MDLQLGVGDRLGADQGQLDLGVGQEEQVLAGVVDGRGTRRRPRPGSLTRSLRRGQAGRSTRSTGIGPSQSSPPVSSKVDEPDDGGSS